MFAVHQEVAVAVRPSLFSQADENEREIDDEEEEELFQ